MKSKKHNKLKMCRQKVPEIEFGFLIQNKSQKFSPIVRTKHIMLAVENLRKYQGVAMCAFQLTRAAKNV